MASNYPTPPTYIEPIGQDPKTGKPYFEPVWLQWFLNIAQLLGSVGGAGGTINHESLANLLGGAASNHWHLKDTEHDSLVNASTAAVLTPTPGGSPWTYQNTSGYRLFMIVVGGTVSDISLSRDNSTYYSIVTQRGFMLSLHDYFQLTYTVAPTLAAFPI